MEQGPFGNDGRLLVRVRSASYAVPGGFSVVISHVGGCANGSRDEELIQCVRDANPTVMNELATAARAVMAVMGCQKGCRIDKDNSTGVLYTEHSQDSSFGASSGMSASTTGTGSLVGERLIEGAQNSTSGSEVVVGCVSQFSSSWPSGIQDLRSSERVLYKGMTLDRASDLDYVPSSVVVNDVAMSLGDDKTTELNGLGDSQHAVPGNSNVVPRVSPSLPATVPYSVSATQDILGALAEYEAGTIAPRPAELDSCDGSLDFMDDVEQSAQKVDDVVLTDHDKIVRLETAVEDERDLFDRLRDIVEDLEVEVKQLLTWKADVMANGCSRCPGKSVVRQDAGSTIPAVPLVGARSSPPHKARPADSRVTTEGPSVANVIPVTGVGRKDNGRGKKAAGKATASVAPAVSVNINPAVPVVPVTILRRPAYATMDENKVTRSFASVAASSASADGYNIVAGRKRFARQKAVTPVPVTSIPVRSRHVTIKFTRARDEKFVLPNGITAGRIRDTLNQALFSLNSGAYFSMCSSGKWGDVMLTLAATKADDIVGYYPALREALEGLGLGDFTFARDTEKVKVFVGMVPLSQFGGGWQPSEWEGRGAFDRLAADIEQSNPGVSIAARPSWAGRLHKLKERKVNNAGLILVVEKSPEVTAMLMAANPRIVVAGRHRVCRLWREDNPTVVCTSCQTVGHRAGECKNKPVCAFCLGMHLTNTHTCPVLSCKKVGTACEHVKRMCILCHSVDHFTGHRECSALRGSSSSPPVLGPATPVVADHTWVVGVSDMSRGRLRRQRLGRPGTPLAAHMVANGVSSVGISEVKLRSEINPDRSTHNREVVVPRLDKGKGIARSPSAPADVSRAGGNVALSQW